MADSGDMITRSFSDFRGVDFSNDPGIVAIQRSPDALNMWKNYSSSQGNCIETRPGYQEIMDFGDTVYGMFVYKSDTALVHAGTKLYLWSIFPEYEEEPEVLHSDMNATRSQMYLFQDKLYINDGKNYLCYDGESLSNVADNAYVPTTSISRYPAGGGTTYEAVNLLTGKRKNSFLADGTSTDYYLDATNINSIDAVYINDELVDESEYTYNLSSGLVTFTTAPEEPSLIGQDTVVIEFTKTVEGYIDRIQNCTIALVFDNRIFYSGNSDYPNALFHSKLNDPSYCSDLDYYEDGVMTAIKALVLGNDCLWVLKESNQNKDTIFYHTPTTDSEYGRIYPNSQGNVSIGCYSVAMNYDDTIIFLSREGMESLAGSTNSLQLVQHKSSLVDNKLINTSNYFNAVIERWQGYVLVGVDDEIYLADNRQLFENNGEYEYEWFYWKLKENVSIFKEYFGKLYIGTDTGKILYMTGTNDNGELIESYWTTPRDVFKYIMYLKTTNKRGAIAKVRNVQNSRIKISVCSNKKAWKLIKDVSTTGFDFTNIDFENFTFSTGDHSYIVMKMKLKKMIDYQIKFYSDELDKPFGLYSMTLEAYLGSFVKRT